MPSSGGLCGKGPEGKFGGKKNAWQDVEVDESVFDKKLIPWEEAESPSKTMMWEQWHGPAGQAGVPGVDPPLPAASCISRV